MQRRPYSYPRGLKRVLASGLLREARCLDGSSSGILVGIGSPVFGRGLAGPVGVQIGNMRETGWFSRRPRRSLTGDRSDVLKAIATRPEREWGIHEMATGYTGADSFAQP